MNSTKVYPQYQVTNLYTERVSIRKFLVAHAASVDRPAEAILEDGGLDLEAATKLVTKWNRQSKSLGIPSFYEIYWNGHFRHTSSP